MRRTAVFLVVLAGALVVPAGAASGHTGESPDATAYRVRVTGISPALSGLRVRTVEAGLRLELTNRTGRDIEVLGAAGEPYLVVRPDGAFENASRADPTAPPSWRRISPSASVRWHDERTRWPGSASPPQAVADPSRAHRLRDWSVPLRDGVRVFEVRGTLDWVPPPSAWLWWVGAALLALAVAAPAGRWSWWPPAVALLAGTTAIWYAVSQTLDGRTPPVVLFATAGIALLPAVLRRTPFPLLLGGAALAAFGGLTQLGVFRDAVVGATGPAWLARTAVLVALGAGLGLAGVGIARIRRLSSSHD